MKLLYRLWQFLSVVLCGHPEEAREPVGMITVYGARIVHFRCRHCAGTISEYFDLPEGHL